MNLSASQCSSGCQSGWTMYLDQSSVSKSKCYGYNKIEEEEDDDYEYAVKGDHEEEEDLSMVSDASSGPRHYCEEDEEYCFDENGYLSSEISKSSKKNKKKLKQHGVNQQHSYLDDTASSPVQGFSKKHIRKEEHVLDFSQGFSTTYLKPSLSLPRKQASGGVKGKNWK